jgi:hypothetical protein
MEARGTSDILSSIILLDNRGVEHSGPFRILWWLSEWAVAQIAELFWSPIKSDTARVWMVLR